MHSQKGLVLWLEGWLGANKYSLLNVEKDLGFGESI
jgi:hypothetical protein